MPDSNWKFFKNIGKKKAHVNFLTKCTVHKLIPKGFFSRTKFLTLKSNHLETRFAKLRMRELLNHLHAKLFNLQLRIDFSNPLPEDILQDLQELQHRTYYFEHLHLESKFKRLKRLASPLSQPPPTQFKLDSVLNLSS